MVVFHLRVLGVEDLCGRTRGAMGWRRDRHTAQMQLPVTDITTHLVADHNSMGNPTAHHLALGLYWTDVVAPSLRALKDELQETRDSEDPTDSFFLNDIADLMQSTAAGFLIAVQSMWERWLRRFLVDRDWALWTGPKDDATRMVRASAIQKARWSSAGGKSTLDLHQHFERLLGLPLSCFDAYADLCILQDAGNAIRHGEGASLTRLLSAHPDLRSVVVDAALRAESWNGAGAQPEERAAAVQAAFVEQMLDATRWFWEDLENIRCNSFARKSASVLKNLAAWPDTRMARAATRVWSPC